MAFDGQLLNLPSGAERPVSEALLMAYSGIHAPLPSTTVVSPNGDNCRREPDARLQARAAFDGDGEPRRARRLGAARLLRPGRPGHVSVHVDRPHRGRCTRARGLWRWVVSATDDRGQPSSFERPFSLNTTLGFGRAVPPALSVPRRQARVVAQFELARAASVTSRIETLSGTIVRKATPAVTLQPGAATVSWDGRTNRGASVHSGTYVARMTAKNSAGSVSLTSKFTVRRTRVRQGQSCTSLLYSRSAHRLDHVVGHGCPDVLHRRSRRLRRLRADVHGRGAARGQRARDALRGRARRRRLRRPGRSRLRTRGAERLAVVRGHGRPQGRSATRSARSPAGGSATTAAGRSSSDTASGSICRRSGSSAPSAGSTAGEARRSSSAASRRSSARSSPSRPACFATRSAATRC